MSPDDGPPLSRQPGVGSGVASAADSAAGSGAGPGWGAGPAAGWGAGPGWGVGLAGAATAVAALTLLSRVVGFGRWGVQATTVGAGCMGSAYAAANAVPNVLFEVVAGGALAAAVVPLLSAPLARGNRDQAARTASALLTWTVLLLVPVAVLVAVFARPAVRAFVPAGGCPGAVDAAARMLVVFAPQVVLYGVAIVLVGVLQAHRRYLWPVLAPLLSSLVVVAAYVLYAVVSGSRDQPAAWLPGRGSELVLSVGTTLGVAALSLPLLLPVRGVRLGLRPTLRFEAGMARRAAGLAGAGLAGLLAQQVVVLVTLRLTRTAGGPGALNVYQYVQAVYLLPYAVLAVPLATVAFPQLSERAAVGDADAFATIATRTTRAVLLVSVAGAAVLVAVAPAVGAFFRTVNATPGAQALDAMPAALTAFAPGLVGFALIAHLGRAMFAIGSVRWAARATVAGWLLAAVASVVLVPLLARDGTDPTRTLVGLGAASSAGMTLAGGLLVLRASRLRVAGRPAPVHGLWRLGALLLVVAAVAVVPGRWVTDALVGPSSWHAVGAGLLGSAVTGVVLLGGLAVTDRTDLRTLARRGRPL